MILEDIKNFLDNEPLIKQLKLNCNHVAKVKSNKLIISKMINKNCLINNICEIKYLLQNKNNLENLHIFCKCGKKNKFKNSIEGYNNYCSTKCANTDLKKIQRIKQTNYSNIDENGLNAYQRGSLKGSQNKLKNIDENGLNGFQRQTLHSKLTKLKKYGDPNYNNSEKCKQTRLNDIDENGLNNYQRASIKTELKKSEIGKDGLNTYQRVVIKRKQDIDKDGNNSFKKAYLKGLQTALNTVDEDGLNNFKKGRIKALETNKKNHNGLHNWASKNPKLNGRETKLKKYGNEFYNNREKAHNTKLSKIDENGLNSYQRAALKSKQHYKDNYGVENINQIHIKHIDDINEKFFRENFIKDNVFLIKECCSYFNTGSNWVIHKKQLFNIIEPNKQNQELTQLEIFNYIKQIYTNVILFNSHKIISPQELDIYIPEKKLAIEFNGVYWHSANKGLDKYYHQNKSKLCQEKGIRLIHIYEDEWNDEHKRDIIKDIIKHALNIPTYENKIYARKCTIKEIENKEYNDFCNKYHIQGTKGAQVKLGLFYNNELVQIASFSKSRYDKQYEWEWIRGCPASNNNVVGGTSKLFKYFVRKYNPKSVLCYADFNKFDGKGYKECGFKFIKITVPDKFYYDTKNCIRINRNPSKYSEYMNKVKLGEFFLLYGAGNLKFIWSNF